MSSPLAHDAAKLFSALPTEEALCLRERLSTVAANRLQHELQRFAASRNRTANSTNEFMPVIRRFLHSARHSSPKQPSVRESFRFLNQRTSKDIFRVLAGEQPQTVAVVLLFCSAECRSEILRSTAVGRRLEIEKRIMTMRKFRPETLLYLASIVRQQLDLP